MSTPPKKRKLEPVPSTMELVNALQSDSVAHYVTGEWTPNTTRLDDDEYGRALDCLVKGCVDLLLLDETGTKVLLGKRKVEPQPDWWFIGGRMKAGDSPLTTAVRNVKRETGLDVDPSRFRPVCAHSMLWARRKQEPMDNGTADIAIVMTAKLSDVELASVDKKLSAFKDEYSDVKTVEVSEVAAGKDYHPALRSAASSILAQNKLVALEKVVKGGGSDQKVAELTRSLFST